MSKLYPNNNNNNNNNICSTCLKTYTRKSSFIRHTLICELLHNKSKREKECESQENTDIPTHHQLFLIVQELVLKNKQLETKVAELQKWADKKKKKINVIMWLETNVLPQQTYTHIISSLVVTREDLKMLMSNSGALPMIIGILRKTFSQQQQHLLPIYSFDQKVNTFYIYDLAEAETEAETATEAETEAETATETKTTKATNPSWQLFSTKLLTKLMNKIYYKVLVELNEWQNENEKSIREIDSVGILYSKTMTKLMSTDFTPESKLLSKIKTEFYNYLKIDLKNIIEYDFEF
jgi:hypothetical protein